LLQRHKSDWSGAGRTQPKRDYLVASNHYKKNSASGSKKKKKKMERKLCTSSSLPTTTADCNKDEIFPQPKSERDQKSEKDERTKSLQGEDVGRGS
jgi:hypothetical protein